MYNFLNSLFSGFRLKSYNLHFILTQPHISKHSSDDVTNYITRRFLNTYNILVLKLSRKSCFIGSFNTIHWLIGIIFGTTLYVVPRMSSVSPVWPLPGGPETDSRWLTYSWHRACGVNLRQPCNNNYAIYSATGGSSNGCLLIPALRWRRGRPLYDSVTTTGLFPARSGFLDPRYRFLGNFWQ